MVLKVLPWELMRADATVRFYGRLVHGIGMHAISAIFYVSDNESTWNNKKEMLMKKILEGIRVIDWTVMHAGPLGTLMLGDLGAEVIKIEDTVRGDIPRGVVRICGVPVKTESGRNAYFELLNRNKKGITLDLNQKEGREIVYKLIEKSDVFVHNRPERELEKRELDYETLSRYNPKLIYFSMPGFGTEGPMKDVLAYDLSGQAISGMMYTMGPSFMPPLYMQGGPVDQTAGTLEAYGIISALLARERFGIGQKVVGSSLTSAIWLQGVNVSSKLMNGVSLPRIWRETEENPLWNYYLCKDNKWIILVNIQPDRFWKQTCEALERPELITDPKFDTWQKRRENCQDLIKVLDAIFINKSRDEWVEKLTKAGSMCAPILTIDEMVDHPQVIADKDIIKWDHPDWGETRYVAHPVKFSKTPAQITKPAPMFGEHTEEILTEMLGMTWDEVTKLKEKKVIA
jgi:crotonobetainyl-CoA:carnitine CoA-transferase CaiB-like acyl-CoA transferase